jgi:hypothetical protein
MSKLTGVHRKRAQQRFASSYHLLKMVLEIRWAKL